MEAAIKLARQYYLEKMPAEPRRTRFIARRQSYHGITLGALGVGGHAYRRNKFEPLLNEHTSLVSPCYPYRDKVAHESDEAYVRRLAEELDAEFTRLGPETVCAFIVEPVVGAVGFAVTRILIFMHIAVGRDG
jgi:adenosylmethionine-8-amino-7-oxononanoate aminotransferase